MSIQLTSPTVFDEEAETDVMGVVEMVRAIRNIRAEFRIDANQAVEAIVNTPEIRELIEAETDAITTLARVDPLTFGADAPAAGGADSAQRVSLVLTKGTVTVPLGGLVDLEREKARLHEELEQIDANLKRLSSRLGDGQFLGKAPEEVVERERQRQQEYAENLKKLEASFGVLSS